MKLDSSDRYLLIVPIVVATLLVAFLDIRPFTSPGHMALTGSLFALGLGLNWLIVSRCRRRRHPLGLRSLALSLVVLFLGASILIDRASALDTWNRTLWSPLECTFLGWCDIVMILGFEWALGNQAETGATAN